MITRPCLLSVYCTPWVTMKVRFVSFSLSSYLSYSYIKRKFNCLTLFLWHSIPASFAFYSDLIILMMLHSNAKCAFLTFNASQKVFFDVVVCDLILHIYFHSDLVSIKCTSPLYMYKVFKFTLKHLCDLWYFLHFSCSPSSSSSWLFI